MIWLAHTRSVSEGDRRLNQVELWVEKRLDTWRGGTPKDIVLTRGGLGVAILLSQPSLSGLDDGLGPIGHLEFAKNDRDLISDRFGAER
jgi:hypothetical protein